MLKCPKCEGEISSKLPKDLPEKNVRFCPICGHNYRYNCPICSNTKSNGQNMISIIGIGYPDPDEIRCPDCNSLLYVCEECGRLSVPWLQRCPNKKCKGRLIKSRDLSSNTYDGTGFCESYKIKLSLNDNKYISKSKEIYQNENDCSELYSAKILGGYLFVWHDTLIDILDIDNNFRKVKQSIPILGAKKSNISPCMALLADNIIIAAEDNFLWFNLNEQVDIDELITGKPVGLISGHCGVAMWTEYNGAYYLYTALCPKANSKPHIKQVIFDSDKYQLMEKSNCLAMSDTELYWQGKYGNIYKYDFFEESLKEIPFDKGKVDYIWVKSNKVSIAYSSSVQFCVCDDLEGKKEEKFYPLTGFVNGIYVYYKDKYSFDYAYIINNEEMHNGVGKYLAPNPDHVNSVLCKEDNGTPVLLSMFKNIQWGGNVFVNIFALIKDSSSSETIWNSETKVEPIEMLCFKDKIFVLHKKGIVVIERSKDNSKNSDTQKNTAEEIEETREELTIDTDFELNDNSVKSEQIIQINKVVEIPNRVAENQELIKKEENPSLGFDFSSDEEDFSLVLDDSSVVICPHCGAEMPKEDTKFCSECGKLIEEKKDDEPKLEDLLATYKKSIEDKK